eukprot:scaffold1123_cov347-Prasinococcus_capsulatus_cf.AAC.14
MMMNAARAAARQRGGRRSEPRHPRAEGRRPQLNCVLARAGDCAPPLVARHRVRKSRCAECELRWQAGRPRLPGAMVPTLQKGGSSSQARLRLSNERSRTTGDRAHCISWAATMRPKPAGKQIVWAPEEDDMLRSLVRDERA